MPKKTQLPVLYPLLGCSRLAEVIDRFPVSAVFHGHAHHGSAQGRTAANVTVYNCSAALMRRLSPQRPYALAESEVA